MLTSYTSARLRARQKDRLAQKKALDDFSLAGDLPGTELLSECPVDHIEENERACRSAKSSGREATTFEVGDKKSSELEVPISSVGTVLKAGKLMKHKPSNNNNSSFKIDGNTSLNAVPGENMGADLANSAGIDYLR